MADMEVSRICAGFLESQVLALKACFYHSDMEELLIEVGDVEGNIAYHNRNCHRSVSETEGEICSSCLAWFQTLSLALASRPADQLQDDDEILLLKNPDLPVQFIKIETDSIVAREPLQDERGSEQQSEDGNKVEDDHDYIEADDYGENIDEDDQPKKRNLRKRRATRRKDASGRLRSKQDNKTDDLKEDSGRPKKDRDELKEDSARPKKGRDDLKEGSGRLKKGRKPTLPVIDIPDGETKCSQCGKEFARRLLLINHMRRHLKIRQPCHICGQLVKELQVHIKIRHTEKDKLRYFCEQCGRGYKGYAAYQFHMAGHTGERKHTCPICQKNYRTNSEQKKCEKGHKGIFKYNCSHDQCSYRTQHKNKYVRHLRTHSKAEPYKCPICSHTAARKDYLTKHLKKAHSHLSLEQIEDRFPDLYTINESVQVVEGDLVVSHGPEKSGPREHVSQTKASSSSEAPFKVGPIAAANTGRGDLLREDEEDEEAVDSPDSPQIYLAAEEQQQIAKNRLNAPEPKANNLTMRNDNLSLPVLVGPFRNKTSFQGNSRGQLKIIIDQPSAKDA